MLVLARKPTEVIEIGDNIRITICSVKGNVVRVGIDAPREVSVRRQELPPAPRLSDDPEDRNHLQQLRSRLTRMG